MHLVVVRADCSFLGVRGFEIIEMKQFFLVLQFSRIKGEWKEIAAVFKNH
jgi:hypothetical protein